MSKKVTIRELLNNSIGYEGKEVSVAGKAENIDFFLGPPWIIFQLDDRTGNMYVHGPKHLEILEGKPQIIPEHPTIEEPKERLWSSNKELEELLKTFEVMVEGLYESQSKILQGLNYPPAIVASQIAIHKDKKWLKVLLG